MDNDTIELVYPSSSNYQELFGDGDRNVKAIASRYDVQIVCRDGAVKIIGVQAPVKQAAKILLEMDELIASGVDINEHTLSSALDYLEKGGSDKAIGLDTVVINAKGRKIRPRSLGQCLYLNSMMENDIVFSIGPAGTGKTLLAVAVAVSSLRNKAVEKIILCRPAVEAGENLGFLPGDMNEKVEPYFRPLYDALHFTIGQEKLIQLQERAVVEVAPLAYMRGRTLANAFIILDEAQNTTSLQMKMLLTRLGYGSKLVVTGDVTQVDLPKNEKSGLIEIESILTGINGISFNRLTSRDVVRHRLVQDIIKAYDIHNSQDSENKYQPNKENIK